MRDYHRHPVMSLRIPRDLADQVRAAAAARGETLTAVTIRKYREYLQDEPKREQT